MTRKRQTESSSVDGGMSTKELAALIGADSVTVIIEEDAPTQASGWTPPTHFVPHLDQLILHNREHPEARLGAIKIAAWLERNGEVVSKDAVHRWLKKRSREV